MLRKLENASNVSICRLLKNIDAGILSMLCDYTKLYSDDEISLLRSSAKIVEQQITSVENGETDYSKLYEIFDYEDILKSLVFRCWMLESENGNEFISWYKYDKPRNLSHVVSATYGNDDSFCNARYGISFTVSIDGFLGACNKDAATLIESREKQSIYTIGITGDGRVINSYNFATPIVTPKQVFDKSNNTYMSKHNEIILDSRLISPKSVIYTNEKDIDMVNLISQQFNIPIEFKKIGYTK